MNTLIMSIPLSLIFLYGFCHMTTAVPEVNRQAKTGIAKFTNGDWLAKGWILGIVILMLTLSITGL